MESNKLRRQMYRQLVEMGQRRFGPRDWTGKMARYATRPRDFAWRVLGSRWWSAQEEVADALVRRRRVAVRSGNGVGKTYLAADLALWFLYAHRRAVVLTTAPTWRQVKHVLWHEIRRRWAGARMRLPGRLLQTRIDLSGDSFAMGLATDGGAGGVRFQGFHAENLLVILDEASGIPDAVWDAAEGVAVGANNRILAIGNPLAASGRFYDLFRGASGWHKVTINALHHPNVTGRGRPIPGCVTEAFVDEKVADWCEEASSVGVWGCGSVGVDTHTPTLPYSHTPDLLYWRGRTYLPSDLFRVRVLGEFPRSDERALIPLAWVEAAQARELPESGPLRPIHAAADVARFGDDCTVIGVRSGPVVRSVRVLRGADTMEVAGALAELAYAEHPVSIAVDAIGIGAGVVDRLREEGIGGVEAVNVAEAAHDRERFANRRAELYWGLRERFRSGDVWIPADPLMAEELATIRYRINARGQIQMESKEEMKRRVRRSPDRADMLAMLFDGSGDWLRSADIAAPDPPSRAARLRAEMRGW